MGWIGRVLQVQLTYKNNGFLGGNHVVISSFFLGFFFARISGGFVIIFRLIGSDFCEDRSRLIFEEAVLQRLGEWQLRGVAIMKA